jgi:glycosyltransferase involved in cell wall biosynthesis
MNIGFFSTRLAGTDGVSLETAKWVQVLERMGHRAFYCAGELDEGGPPGVCVPAMHFRDEQALALSARAFGAGPANRGLIAETDRLAQPLLAAMSAFVEDRGIELLVVQNALAIPMQLPLAQALADLIERTGLPTVCHHHDFYWERDRFKTHRLGSWLGMHFPFDAPNMRHVVIHSMAQQDLGTRRSIESVVVPNVYDFASEPPGIDEFNADFREAVGLSPDRVLVLQPTRVVPRKGIEFAIELLDRLGRPDASLVITHEAGDEGLEYLEQLRRQARDAGVDLRYVPELVGPRREQLPDGQKRYGLWDAYPHADLVTYPSLYEGFGNAFIETIYFRKPVLVNRYPVYTTDIGPKGFLVVEIDGQVTDDAVEEVRELLDKPDRRRETAEHNFELGRQHFSFELLEERLRGILASF